MTTQNIPKTSDIAATLGIDEESKSRQSRVLIVTVISLFVVILAGVFFFKDDTNDIQFITSPATSGDLTILVTATGSLQPVNQVEVGSEISGLVKSVLVDFNDEVTKGQALAELDTDQLQAKLRQSRASLQLSEAKIREAQATVVETRNKLTRSRELLKKALCSAEECDASEAAYARAEAALGSAKAQVTQVKAQLDSDQTALKKAIIRSPINGIILSRKVEPGQTVTAAFQTPVLFTLAEDLKDMQLHVDVDEADVGNVKQGQQASFTVDAYPDRHFKAEITQVRFAPQTVEGVVTYGTLLSVNNSDLALRPGMTATAEIVTKTIPNAVMVPNAALRFTPPLNDKKQKGLFNNMIPKRPVAKSDNDSGISENSIQQVWLLREGQPVAIPVTVGSTDGRMTEVLNGNVQPGMQLLIDVEQTEK